MYTLVSMDVAPLRETPQIYCRRMQLFNSFHVTVYEQGQHLVPASLPGGLV